MRNLIKRPQALLDMIEAAAYLSEHAGFEITDRFLEVIEKTFSDIAERPGIGAIRKNVSPRLAGLRMWQVPRFSVYLILYIATDESIEIVRVVHGSRNIDRLLEQT